MVFAANALQNSSKFFMPHPPSSFGRAKVFHFTRGIPSVCLLVVHKKEKRFFLIFVKIHFGMYAIEAQYTGIFCRTDF